MIRFKFTKEMEAKYLSHLDILNLFSRAVLRAGLKISYSEGFSPKPKITFSNPIPLGVKSIAEYSDIILMQDIDILDFVSSLNSKLPKGILLTEAIKTDRKLPALMSVIDIVFYQFELFFEKKEILENALETYINTNNSVFSHKFEISRKNNFFLKIFGYAKIFKHKDNNIFKYNDFFRYLSSLSSSQGVVINDSCKMEVYVLQEEKLLTPFEIIREYV